MPILLTLSVMEKKYIASVFIIALFFFGLWVLENVFTVKEIIKDNELENLVKNGNLRD